MLGFNSGHRLCAQQRRTVLFSCSQASSSRCLLDAKPLVLLSVNLGDATAGTFRTPEAWQAGGWPAFGPGLEHLLQQSGSAHTESDVVKVERFLKERSLMEKAEFVTRPPARMTEAIPV